MARSAYRVLFSNAEIAYGGKAVFSRNTTKDKPAVSPAGQKDGADATAAFVSRLFGQNLKIDWFHETEESIFIRLVSVSESAVCPYCGRKSTKHHGREVRYLLDLGMYNKPCYIKVVLKRHRLQESMLPVL